MVITCDLTNEEGLYVINWNRFAWCDDLLYCERLFVFTKGYSTHTKNPDLSRNDDRTMDDLWHFARRMGIQSVPMA